MWEAQVSKLELQRAMDEMIARAIEADRAANLRDKAKDSDKENGSTDSIPGDAPAPMKKNNSNHTRKRNHQRRANRRAKRQEEENDDFMHFVNTTTDSAIAAAAVCSIHDDAAVDSQ